MTLFILPASAVMYASGSSDGSSDGPSDTGSSDGSSDGQSDTGSSDGSSDGTSDTGSSDGSSNRVHQILDLRRVTIPEMNNSRVQILKTPS